MRETHTAHIIKKYTNSSIVAYGLGWEITAENGMVRVGHGGDLTSGVSTYIMLYPAEKMAIVILTNGFPEGHVLKWALTSGWDDLYFSGEIRKDWYGELEEQLMEAMKPGASVIGPLEGLPPAPTDAKPLPALARVDGHDPDGVMAGSLRYLERGAPDHSGNLVFFAIDLQQLTVTCHQGGREDMLVCRKRREKGGGERFHSGAKWTAWS